jgi:uncharacterized protein (DUF1330 family)
MSETATEAAPPAYVINQIEVTDPERFMSYAQAALPIIQAHGGEIIVRGGAPEALWGASPGNRVVIIRFPSREAARAWRHSAAYAAILPIRDASSTSTVYVVDGLAT